MKFQSRPAGVYVALVLSLSALGAVTAQTQPEPRVQHIHQAANAGEIARAQRMADELLKSHPRSAKAHYLKAELSARQHNYVVAREELAAAEQLAPGLPFVKPEPLQSLRKLLAQAQ